MENEIKIFLENINNSKIVTIGGNAATGKSVISSIICEYFLLKNKKCVVFDSNMDDSISNRIHNSKNLQHKVSNFQKIIINDLENLTKAIEEIKDSLIIIDAISSFEINLKKDNGNIASSYIILKKFIEKIRNIAISNNNIFIITSLTYIDMTKNSQIIKFHNNTMVYSSDIVGTCYKDKVDNELKFSIQKSRSGNIITDLPIFNISKHIKGILRKEKIAKLLAENLEN